MAIAQNPAAEFQRVLARAASEKEPSRVRRVFDPGRAVAPESEPVACRITLTARSAVPERVPMSNLPGRKGSATIPQMGSTQQGQIVRRVGKPQN